MNDLELFTEALRTGAKRLANLANRRDAIGPERAEYRKTMRARARRCTQLAEAMERGGPALVRALGLGP